MITRIGSIDRTNFGKGPWDGEQDNYYWIEMNISL